MANTKRSFVFSIYCNGWSLALWFRGFDPIMSMQSVYGFEIRKQHTSWRWVKIYKGDYGLMYSEGKKGKEVVGWKLRGPFEFTQIQGGWHGY